MFVEHSYIGGCLIIIPGNAVIRGGGFIIFESPNLQNFENEEVISNAKKNFLG